MRRPLLAGALAAQLIAASAFLAIRPADGTTGSPPTTAVSDSQQTPRSVRAVSLGGARTDLLLRRVRADLDGAVAAVERFWGDDWPREIVIVATDSDAQFVAEAHLDPRRQWTDIAAVAVADEVDPTDRLATGQRIVLAPGASVMSDPALRIVLTHELFHLAARADTALDAPRWLTEGVADFVARPAAPIPPGAAANTALPTDADLDRPGPDRSAGYDRAWWFARFVANGYGTDGLRRLYVAACGPGHGDLATAVRRALGVDLAELQNGWAGWLNR